MKKLFVCLSILFFAISCKDVAAEASPAKISITEMAEAPAVMDEAASAVDLDKPETGDESNITNSPEKTTETKIIKTGNLRFESSNLESSFQTVQKAVAKHKAIIQNDDSGKDDYSVYRNFTIRIPNQDFDAFISEISQGVSHFDKKEISQQDVTEEYVDIEARMNAKKKLEARYIQLLTKANKVSEMLEIEKQLAEIREEIEAKEGRLKYMQSQVSMSTINIEMYTNNPSESGVTVSYGGKIWNEIKSGFNGLSSFLLGIIGIWPFIIIFVVLFIFIKRRFKKKTR
ncbi:MAG: DUF4349 domain-containing protein [Flavobacterium sp.]|uniref:DUF4349 domain-containing protein n=1 Tax=Flavobacterium sp. TaxID=239 RepID=UPI003267DCC8